jgi:hypothetical protein
VDFNNPRKRGLGRFDLFNYLLHQVGFFNLTVCLHSEYLLHSRRKF